MVMYDLVPRCSILLVYNVFQALFMRHSKSVVLASLR